MNVLVVGFRGVNRAPAVAAILTALGHNARAVGLSRQSLPVTRKIREALAVKGFPIPPARSTPLNDLDVVDADLIVVVDALVEARFEARYPGVATTRLGWWADPVQPIPDPFYLRRHSRVFNAVVNALVKATLKLEESL